VFLDVSEATKGDDGWVSFELDPLLEDHAQTRNTEERSAEYIRLGKKWAAGHTNRMIKVPATPGGLGAIEELVAAGICPNITLIFSERQYILARDAVYRGAQRRSDKENVKSVYSIFVSRVDVYTEKHVPTLIPAAQGQVGIVNAKRIYAMNKEFWAGKGFPRKQEMIFASTGTKKMADGTTPPAWKYVEALAGDDIETNPPQTNEDVQKSGRMFTKQVDQMPPAEVLADIDAKVDMKKLEETLMSEGLAKFAEPHKALIALIAKKRAELK
jgi:transaldolase